MKVRSLALRPPQPTDAPFLFDLYTTTRDVVATAGWDETERLMFLRQEYHAREAHFHGRFPAADAHLICVGVVRVGRLVVNRSPDELHVVDIAVLPEFDHEIIATQLLQVLVDEARADGVPVRMWAAQLNPALRLYRRLGFAVVAEQGGHALLESTSDACAPSTPAPKPARPGASNRPSPRRNRLARLLQSTSMRRA